MAVAVALVSMVAACRPVPTYIERDVTQLPSLPGDCHTVETVEGDKLCATQPELTVAFFGDQSLGQNARRVLELVKSEGASMLLHLGDFDYDENPLGWDRLLSETLGADFPVFGVIGNHDTADWPTYQYVLSERFKRLAPGRAHCRGDLLVRSTCSFEGLYFVASGVGTLGDSERHEQHIERALSQRRSIWKLCAWHKNQHDMQAGAKQDAIGWRPYQLCQQAGAIVVSGHEHVYGRTRALGAVGDADRQHGATGAADKVELGPGRTMAFVSGLGGRDVRRVSARQAQAPWWASIAASDYLKTNGEQRSVVQPLHGALFITFHVDGDPYLARGYFKTIDGQVIDRFELRTKRAVLTQVGSSAP